MRAGIWKPIHSKPFAVPINWFQFHFFSTNGIINGNTRVQTIHALSSHSTNNYVLQKKNNLRMQSHEFLWSHVWMRWYRRIITKWRSSCGVLLHCNDKCKYPMIPILKSRKWKWQGTKSKPNTRKFCQWERKCMNWIFMFYLKTICQCRVFTPHQH